MKAENMSICSDDTDCGNLAENTELFIETQLMGQELETAEEIIE